MDQAKADELKEKHGENIVLLECDGVELVFRPPKRAEYDRWFDKRDEKGSEAARELAQSCLVYPDRAGMIAVLDKQPALLMCRGGILDTITDLAGLGTAETTVKKL